MHYKNGRSAQVGDLVIGTTYNRKGVQVGVLIGITPGQNTCNCRVAVIDVLPTEKVFGLCGRSGLVHVETTGRDIAASVLSPWVDYSEVGNLLHAEDVWQFISDTVFAKQTPDMLGLCMNFNKRNAPVTLQDALPTPTSQQ